MMLSRGICLGLSLIVLTACTSPLKNWDHTAYTVQSGDTLYSIAWRYEIDPGDLARWNGLSNTSLIHPGQRLATRAPTASSQNKTPKREDVSAQYIEVAAPKPVPLPLPSKDTVIVQKGDTLYGIARRHGVPASQLIVSNRLKKPYTIRPGQELKLRRSGSKATVAKPEQKRPVKRKRLTWAWPIRGKLIKKFDGRRLDAKGIDIDGQKGNQVKAAAGGKVVYSGDGLINYGNLVIIKHNNTYLSAYANNASVMVKEGDFVEQGQAIARLGSRGSGKSYLHFEIRKSGKPVDPLRYLPSS